MFHRKQQQKPVLILISGRPGQGKTTLARKLSEELRLLHLDIDEFAEQFDHMRDEHYQKEIEPALIDIFLKIANVKLRAGKSIIINLCWTHYLINHPELQSRIQTIAKNAGALLAVIECNIQNHEIWYQRIKSRGLERDDKKLTPAGWKIFLEKMHVDKGNPLPHCLINTEEPLEICYAKAMQYLGKSIRCESKTEDQLQGKNTPLPSCL